MLGDKIEYYHQTQKKLNNTPAQYKTEFEWLKEVDSLALANAQINLQDAYNNFFRDKRVGFPKFKSKKDSKRSYTTNCVNGNIIVRDGMIRLPKLGFVKMKQHRNIPDDYKLKSVTVSQTASGKYYVSILFEYENQVQKTEPQKCQKWKRVQKTEKNSVSKLLNCTKRLPTKERIFYINSQDR